MIMSRMSRVIAVLVCQALSLISIANPQRRSTPAKLAEAAELERKIRRFAPTILTAETSRLSANDRNALQKIIAAAKLYDPLYLRQLWNGNEPLLQKLQAEATPLGRLRLHYFM